MNTTTQSTDSPPPAAPKSRHHDTASYLRAMAGLALLLLSLGLVLHLSLPYPWGDAHLWAKLRYLDMHADKLDTVFIGSSYTYRQISPRVFDEEINRLRQQAGADPRRGQSFNLGVDGLHLPATARLFRHLLSQDPALETVVIELGRFTSAVDPEIDHSPEAQYWRTPGLTTSMIRFLWHRPDKGVGQKIFQSFKLIGVQIESVLHFGQGLRILEFLRGDPSLDAEFLGPDGDGFYAVDRQALNLTGRTLDSDLLRRKDGQDILDRMRRSATEAFERTALGPPNAEGLRMLSDLTADARDAGIDLFFLVPPRLGKRYEQLRPLLEKIPPEQLIDEPADPRLFPELYALDESADRGHLNEKGAQRYSRLVAEQIARRTIPEAESSASAP